MTEQEKRDETYRRIGQLVYGIYQREAVKLVRMAIKRRHLHPIGNRRCEDCGRKSKHYEHRDYGQPLDVRPVCQSCNIKRGPAELSSARIARDIMPYAEIFDGAWCKIRGWKNPGFVLKESKQERGGSPRHE